MKCFLQRLSDGVERVIVAGGITTNTGPTLLYNSATNSWKDLPSLGSSLSLARGWVLQNGDTFYMAANSEYVYFLSLFGLVEKGQILQTEWGRAQGVDPNARHAISVAVLET